MIHLLSLVVNGTATIVMGCLCVAVVVAAVGGFLSGGDE